MNGQKAPWHPTLHPDTEQSVKDAIRKAYDDLYFLQDRINKVAQGAASKTSLSSLQSQASAVQTRLASMSGYDFQTTGSSSSVRRSQGSMLPTISGSLTYDNATANVVKWFSTGLTILWPDGVTTLIPDTTVGTPSISVSGLAVGSYFFYPYYSISLNLVQWALVSGGTGTPAVAYAAKSAAAAQVIQADGNVALSVGGISAAATGGGGGGGSGGGSGCLRSSMLVEREDGIVPLWKCQVGDEILGPQGLTVIKRRIVQPQWGIIHLECGPTWIETSPSHPFLKYPLKEFVPARDWSLKDSLFSRSGVPFSTRRIEVLPEEQADVILIECSPSHEFYAGGGRPDLLIHNFQPLK